MNDSTSNPGNAGNSAEAIFEAASQLSPEQRVAYLDKACAGAPDLRRQIESLLQAHDAAGTFLNEPAAGPAPGRPTIVLSFPLEEKAGDRIGRYKLLQKIGEGGCGVVYMAEQEEPVRRRVALKVIKLGMDTKQVVARFEAERQALALMDHPNIAKVFDAGATETGRPYFVMELVRGIRMTDYCDQNKLSTRDRLGLFIQVCNAIQHAHQKGIIHRDIKPSNIIVTLHDGMPVPKVIDFGIAKATQGRLTDQTLFTAFEQFIGTPAYMSPEQAEMSGLDIDTRSDIYSLGVLLYELLTGRTPFDPRELLQVGIDELRRMIREQEPERPSTRLSTMLNVDLTAVAVRRQSDAPKLIHLLRGDLDWIVMKSLEKDRTRRYATANGLAADIQRALSNEPIVARPPSNLYRFQKLVRRNRTTVAAIGTGVVVLIIGLVVSVFLFMQEREARRRAVAAEQEQARMRREAEEGAAIGMRIARAGLLLTQDRIDEAVALISDVPPDVSMLAFYNVFGTVYAQRGHWREALTNFALVVQFAPADPSGYHSLVPLLLKVNDREGYQRCRQQMLDQFCTTTDPEIASRMARHSLLIPPSAGDRAIIGRMVETAFSAGTNHRAWGSFLMTKALADYRAEDYASSAEKAERVLATEGSARRVQAGALLALSRLHRGELAESRASIAVAADLAARQPTGRAGALDREWVELLVGEVLLQEAQMLIKGAGNLTGVKVAEPVDSELERLRASAIENASRGRWPEAAADFGRLQELQPGDGTWYERAAILAYTGDMEGYRRQCEWILGRFADTTSSSFARRVAKGCLLMPAAEASPFPPAAVMEIISSQSNEWQENVMCLVEYRAGRFANAVEWATRGLGRTGVERRDAQTYMVLAMAHERLGHRTEARAAFASGSDLISRLPKPDSGELGSYWLDCIIAHILLREATGLLEGSRR